MAAVNKKLKCIILQQVNVTSLLLLQMLATIENYQELKTINIQKTTFLLVQKVFIF